MDYPIPYKAVIWDLGGVILRTENWEPRRRLDKMLDLPDGKLYELVFESDISRKATVGEASNDDVWTWVSEQLNLSSDTLKHVREGFWSGDEIDQDIVHFIRTHKNQAGMGLLSNGWPSTRHLIDERWQISDIFNDIIISAEVGLAKPDRQIYQLAIDRLGVEAEHTIFVDDVQENIHGARAVGIHGVHFRDPKPVLETLSTLLNTPPDTAQG